MERFNEVWTKIMYIFAEIMDYVLTFLGMNNNADETEGE